MATYEEILAERKTAYAYHVTEMSVDPAILSWAARMIASTGSPTVKVWHNDLPWVEALMVVRYGEAVESWPSATTIADWGRALDWESGKEVPHAVERAKEMSIGSGNNAMASVVKLA